MNHLEMKQLKTVPCHNGAWTGHLGPFVGEGLVFVPHFGHVLGQ